MIPQAEAAGMPIQRLFKEYLYEKFNMTQTFYGPLPTNPSMVGDVTMLFTSFTTCGCWPDLFHVDGLVSANRVINIKSPSVQLLKDSPLGGCSHPNPGNVYGAVYYMRRGAQWLCCNILKV
jgi:CubicO group peptidase (beta-lactamase class C family)